MVTDFLRSERYFGLFSLSLRTFGIKWRDALQLSPFFDSKLSGEFLILGWES